MPRTLMQSVISELQKERKRLQDELHRVAAALTAFGNVYLHGSRPTRKTRTISVAGRKRIAAVHRGRHRRETTTNTPIKKYMPAPLPPQTPAAPFKSPYRRCPGGKHLGPRGRSAPGHWSIGN